MYDNEKFGWTSKKPISKKLIKIFSRSAYHGVRCVLKSKKFSIKLIGICLILALIFYFFYMLFDKETSFNKYLHHQTEMTWQTLKLNKMPFPVVTICNLEICGFLDFSLMKQIEQETYNDAETKKAIETRLKLNSSKSNLNWVRKLFEDKYNDEKIEQMLLNRRDEKMLLSCQFSGKTCSEENKEFRIVKMNKIQKCLQFNWNRSSEVISGSKKFGLKLEMFIGEPVKCRSPYSSTSGVAIYIQNETSTHIADLDPILVEPGTEANIAIARTSINRYSDCLTDMSAKHSSASDLVKQTLKVLSNYQPQYCLSLCYELKVHVDCVKECPNKCEENLFKSTVSKLNYPSRFYKTLLNSTKPKQIKLNNNETLDETNTLAINIYYRSHELTLVNEKPTKTLDRFLAEFGCCLKFLIGVSIFIILEIFEALFEVYFSYIQI